MNLTLSAFIRAIISLTFASDIETYFYPYIFKFNGNRTWFFTSHFCIFPWMITNQFS